MSLCLSTASAWQEAKVVFLENKIWNHKVGFILQLSTSFIFKEAFEMKNSNSNTIKYNRSYNRSNKTNRSLKEVQNPMIQWVWGAKSFLYHMEKYH